MMSENQTDTWAMDPYFKGWGGPVTTGRHLISIRSFEGPDVPILQDGFLTLELREDVTAEEAEKLINLLNLHVDRLTHTGPTKPEFVDQPGRAAVAKRKSSR